MRVFFLTHTHAHTTLQMIPQRLILTTMSIWQVKHSAWVVLLLKPDFSSVFLGSTYAACIFRSHSVILSFFVAIYCISGLEWLKIVRSTHEAWDLKIVQWLASTINLPGKPTQTALSAPNAREMAQHGTCEILWLPLWLKWKNNCLIAQKNEAIDKYIFLSGWQ